MNTASELNMSAQELAIQSGKNVLSDVSERVLRMSEKIRLAGEPRIGLERAIAFTEAFKKTEGQHISTRWGKALLEMAATLPVTILDDELIVGRVHDFFGRTGPIWPELDGSIWSAGAVAIMQNQGKSGTPVMTEADKKIIDEVITPYWKTRDFKHAYHEALPEETRRMLYGPNPENVLIMTGVMVESATMRSSQQWISPYGEIISRGCTNIREELAARLAALTTPEDLLAKKPFLEAAIMSLDALVTWVGRHARLAAELAAKEANAQRKKELQDIAACCEWAPANPPRSFREALQVQWFIQLFTQIEHNVGGGQMCGRMDQYLGPYYARDLAAGKITREAAMELLQCVWLNMTQMAQVKMSPSNAAGNEGYAHFELIALGGLDANGQDATNELSYVILDSARPLPISHPDLGARIHANTPDRFLHAVAEVIKDGKGIPKVFNDEMIIPFYLAFGCTPEEANNYVPTSCADSRVMARETHNTGNGGFNWAAIVEMVLRNGRIRVHKDMLFGIETGDPRTFANFDDVRQAFRAQLEHLLRHTMLQQLAANSVKGRYLAAPVATLSSPILMEACVDLNNHVQAAWHPRAIDMSMVESIGMGTAIDCMAAIKHLIFDTKKLTWDQLLEALECNWEGKESIRQLCVNAPKYGNGIEWVDKLGWDMEHLVLDYCDRHRKTHGQRFAFKMVPITFHVPMGKAIAATPNGRRAGEFLSEGISPSHGMDVKGPTSALMSMARAHCTSLPGAGPELINMKVAPTNLAGDEGTRRLMQIIRTWCSLKLWHLQFNILNRDTLLAAQKEPEKYRNLIVRIAGYSAYFVDLSPSLQAEILARTEQAM